MEYQDINLSSLMSKDEFKTFEGLFEEITEKYSDVIGIVATGSLFQYRDYRNFKTLPKRIQNNYFAIDAAKARNLGYNKSSDIDIWVTLRDKNLPEEILESLDQKAIDLIEAYSEMDKDAWARLCNSTFGEFAKNEKHYQDEWIRKNNSQYWKSTGFQRDLINLVTENMGDFCDRFSYFFDKSLSDFLEVRAFPESLLHVKMSTVNSISFDRVPLPIYLKSWLTDYNAHVLYAHNDARIFPFEPEGVVLGEKIGKHFGLDRLSEEELYLRKF